MLKVRLLLESKHPIDDVINRRPILKSVLGESLSFSDYFTQDIPYEQKPITSLRSLHENPDFSNYTDKISGEEMINDWSAGDALITIITMNKYGRVLLGCYGNTSHYPKLYCNNQEVKKLLDEIIDESEKYPNTHEHILEYLNEIDKSVKTDRLKSLSDGDTLGRMWINRDGIRFSFWSSQRNTIMDKRLIEGFCRKMNIDIKKCLFEFPISDERESLYPNWMTYNEAFKVDIKKLKDSSAKLKEKLASLVHLSPEIKKALLANKSRLHNLSQKLNIEPHKLSYILNYNLAENKLVKEGGKLFGTKASRVTTDEMIKVFQEVKEKLNKYFSRMELSKALPTKADHGDIDIVATHKSIRQPIKTSLTNPNGLGKNAKEYSKNGNIHSVLYHSDVINKDVHIDFIEASEEDYDAQYEYLSYNDFSGILGVLARQLGYSYSSEGFFKIYVDKRGTHHKLLISKNLRDGLKILGYGNVLNTFDKIQSSDDIITFISASPLFDSSYYVGQTMNHSDRKRVRSGRPTADYVRQGLILTNKKATITDPDYFLKKLFPQKVEDLEKQKQEIESKVVPKSIYNGEWMMRNFNLTPGPILGKIKAELNRVYGQDLDNVPEEKVKETITNFLSLKENYYLESSERKNISSKNFSIKFGEFSGDNPNGKIYLGDKWFANVIFVPREYGKYGEKWVINKHTEAFNLKYNYELPFDTLEDMLKHLEEWYESLSIKEQMFPKEFDRHSLGSCMAAAELASKYFLKKGIKDFKVVEGWVSLSDDIEDDESSLATHTWIEFENGRIFDPTKNQWRKWGYDPYGVKIKKIKKKYTPEEYFDLCEWDPSDWKKFKKQSLNEENKNNNIKWIIGYVDAYGKVHHYVEREETSSSINKKETIQHSSVWPTTHHKRWRWNPKMPKHINLDSGIDEEEIDRIWQIIDKYR